ncbi:glycosyltransferase family 2 protein [Punctularia strigosozonata HHB-11173 SS5]|uniref:glycosyltransferase family 2 protein n=1 Tax=Punctularia strigosozonata (strain HHB-11173) TaxID=741275 RepID=UPI0004416CAC|nr:glycosyltransferase family 2 protein [Punctularia strigosozonata HHB-11173 SS5]EIN11447.1 glycosyltransferase family 2 protein [Punctularia strigosozonata HHB-11173 SS5]
MSAAVRYDSADVPRPTTRAPGPAPARGATVRRAKTLTRPERGVAPPPLIAPTTAVSTASPVLGTPLVQAGDEGGFDAWRLFTIVITFWAPSFLLQSVGGLKDKNAIHAWREKMALCIIIAVMCAVVGFATVGLQKVLCPQTTAGSGHTSHFSRLGSTSGTLGVAGWQFNVSNSKSTADVNFIQLAQKQAGQDITTLFTRDAKQFSKCGGLNYRIAVDEPCNSVTKCTLPALNASSTFTTLGLVNTSLVVGYDWDQVAALSSYLVLDGAVLNLSPYLSLHPNAISGDAVDAALRTVLKTGNGKHGKDGTRLFYNSAALRAAVPCLQQRYYAGNIDKVTPGCFVAQLVLYAGLIVIMALILIRFAMACVFNWFLSERLAGPVDTRELRRQAVSPAVMPEGANVAVDSRHGTAPWAGPAGTKKITKGSSNRPGAPRSLASSTSTLVNGANDAPAPVMSLAQIGAELFAVCLVTAYSEGEESMRATLDSVSATTYSDARKLIFVVADGMITGAGEKRSTPDICVGLLDADPRFGNPTPMSYFAVGSGKKKENRAMVYAGHYTAAGRRTPTIIVVKCGTEQEAATDKKPGNRGKRDSQLILMNFFSRVTYNDRMTPLDYDLFRKIHVLMGVTPDFFEVCLMVDADTKVFPESLKYLVNCMHHDPMIMGVCGETRIANKRDSWVTAIQVFEYFISHHMAKAFESVFGGVSCLPGCFSMFRLKARKSTGDDWVPLIVKPEIVNQYSQSEVTTLHQKNLLLLGEDRFLTTLLIRTFPNRKMMFLPQARCRTVVPDTFSILLSQRRRWINSTIHNLMELVLVRNLCGTFCFSMQFVVFMDLLGTVVLPVAIVLTYILIVSSALSPPKSFDEAIPLVLLVAVLGLPAVLILITTRKVVYVFWMLVYLMALPVWNFVLPVYAFWHFDDFSWGETRKVEGEAKGEAHGEGGGTFDGSSVPLRRWEDWERSRLRKLKRQERRKRELERAFPNGYDADGGLVVPSSTRTSTYDGSDTMSLASSAEEDQWGGQIGGYNENSTAYPAPPLGLYQHQPSEAGKTLGARDLEAMLEMGFDDPPQRTGPGRPQQQMPPQQQSMRAPPGPARFQLSDSQPQYTPLSRDGASPTTPGPHGMSSGSQYSNTHARKRSGGRGEGDQRGRYGPLGPLDPGGRI